MNSSGLPLQAHDTLHAHDTPLAHGAQLSDTTRIDENSAPPIHSDGIVDPNFSQIDKDKIITDVSFPVISSADYEVDAEFSGMFQCFNICMMVPYLAMSKKTSPF